MLKKSVFRFNNINKSVFVKPLQIVQTNNKHSDLNRFKWLHVCKLFAVCEFISMISLLQTNIFVYIWLMFTNLWGRKKDYYNSLNLNFITYHVNIKKYTVVFKLMFKFSDFNDVISINKQKQSSKILNENKTVCSHKFEINLKNINIYNYKYS